MTFQELPEIARALPAILRAKNGGALILEEARTDPAKGTVAVIRDPSSAEDVVFAVDELHLAEVWEGEAILIKRRHFAADDEQSQRFDLLWLVRQVLREKKLFNGIVLAAVVGSVFAIAPAFVMRIIIDRVIVNQSLTTLNVLMAVVLLLLIFEMVLGFLRRLLTEVIVTRIDGRMGLYVVEKVLKLPMEYFERTPTGRIVTQLNQTKNIRHFLESRFFIAVVDIVPVVLLIPTMLIIEWHMALMAFALGGIVFVIVLVYMKPMHNLYIKVIQADQAKGSHLNETIYGMKTIKSLSLEGRRRRTWDHLVADAITSLHELGLMANYPETLALPFERLIHVRMHVPGRVSIPVGYRDFQRGHDHSGRPDGLLPVVRPTRPAPGQYRGNCSVIWRRREVRSAQWDRS